MRSRVDPLFLLVGELGSTNVATTKLYIENTLHGGKNLLVWGSRATLEIGDDRLRRVTLSGKIFLCHLGLHRLTSLGDNIANLLANGVGLDDVVRSVDLGHALTLCTAHLFSAQLVCYFIYDSWQLALFLVAWRAASGLRTELAEEYFFSAVTPPARWAAFRAAFPRTTVSRCEAPGPRARLPILVTASQSSDILKLVEKVVRVRRIANGGGN